MKKKQYDLNFKKMVLAKGKEIGNMTAVARQHKLDPQIVLRWTRELNRKDVDQLDGNSISFVLRVLEVERSTYYAHVNSKQHDHETISGVGRPAPGLSYTQDGKPVSDEQIGEWIMTFLAGEGANYGYRKLTVLLRRRHESNINKKKVYRICQQKDVLRPQLNRMMKHPKRLANNRVITASNQL